MNTDTEQLLDALDQIMAMLNDCKAKLTDDAYLEFSTAIQTCGSFLRLHRKLGDDQQK